MQRSEFLQCAAFTKRFQRVVMFQVDQHVNAREPASALRAPASSKHGGMNSVWRRMAIEERLDVDDNFLAHVNAAFERRRSHVRQCDDAFGDEKFGVDRRFVLKDVETGAGD